MLKAEYVEKVVDVEFEVSSKVVHVQLHTPKVS